MRVRVVGRDLEANRVAAAANPTRPGSAATQMDDADRQRPAQHVLEHFPQRSLARVTAQCSPERGRQRFQPGAPVRTALLHGWHCAGNGVG